ncbi:MAG: hypothetical protein IT359_17365 [Gemmatimonadaceae bacterium]|nr:hypothetical protein [Gemmatimonadaceae bacterium]
MTRPPRRNSRRQLRRHLRPVTPAPDVYEVLNLLAEYRGTPEAQHLLHIIAEPFWSNGSWRELDPLLRMIQAMADAGLFSAEERFFLVGHLSDAVVPSRAREDPRFPEVEREMQQVREEHDLAEGEDWYLPEAPEAYRRLNDEWCRITDQEMAKWFRELGEYEIAWLLVGNQEEFEARWDVGRRELFGIDDDHPEGA